VAGSTVAVSRANLAGSAVISTRISSEIREHTSVGLMISGAIINLRVAINHQQC
jgi:hypothetical protein